MKKQITAVMMMLAMAATPVLAQNPAQGAFETRVFYTEEGNPMQLAELSAQEMKETEGALLPFAAVVLGGGAVGAWGNHIHSYNKTGQWASVDSTLKATGTGMMMGTSLYGAGRVATPHTGTISNWIRVKNSYSQTMQIPTKSVTWGSNRHFRQNIGNERIREINKSFRETKLPGSSWRVQDKGHFHLWKRK